MWIQMIIILQRSSTSFEFVLWTIMSGSLLVFQKSSSRSFIDMFLKW